MIGDIANQTVESNTVRQHRRNSIGIYRITRNHQFIEIRIITCRPCDIYLTGSLVRCYDIIRDGTLRRGLQFDAIEHDSMTKVVRSFERNLIRGVHFGQRQFHSLPIR